MTNPTGAENNKVITESGGRLNAYPNEPQMELVSLENGWGLHKKAETLNGRIAMIGFISIIAIEFLYQEQTFISLITGIIHKYI